MADMTASTAFRDMLADLAANSLYYYATLHDATGGFTYADTYSAGVRGEIATANGYTRGAKEIDLTHTGSTGGILDAADAVWTASGGSIGPVSYCAVWVNTSQTTTGAKLLAVKDTASSPQTATDGNTMTFAVTDMITIPTPS